MSLIKVEYTKRQNLQKIKHNKKHKSQVNQRTLQLYLRQVKVLKKNKKQDLEDFLGSIASLSTNSLWLWQVISNY